MGEEARLYLELLGPPRGYVVFCLQKTCCWLTMAGLRGLGNSASQHQWDMSQSKIWPMGHIGGFSLNIEGPPSNLTSCGYRSFLKALSSFRLNKKKRGRHHHEDLNSGLLGLSSMLPTLLFLDGSTKLAAWKPRYKLQVGGVGGVDSPLECSI